MYEIASVHSVNGHKFRNLEEHLEDGTLFEFTEVLTPHCGWKDYDCNSICTKACDAKCKLCQEFLDMIGIKY